MICTHIRFIIFTTLSPLDLWTDPAGVTALLARWTEKLAGGPQAGTSDSPPLARAMGVGRQQQALPSQRRLQLICSYVILLLLRVSTILIVFSSFHVVLFSIW